MPSLPELRHMLQTGALDGALTALYGDPAPAKMRIETLCDRFADDFGEKGALSLFSAPGRTEIGGNHTDHNHGRVLCAAVNLDALCLIRKEPGTALRLHSCGFPPDTLDIADTAPQEGESPSAALIRGVCNGLQGQGYAVGGFCAVTHSQVDPGSGLSSSAAFENLIGIALHGLYNEKPLPPLTLAKIGQRAENLYMHKPSGLMDQCASAFGGLLSIDFRHPEAPDIRPADYDFARSGHALCIIGPLGSHAGLNDAYAAIPADMKQVAAALGADALGEVTPEDFLARLPELAGRLPHRALLRAHHFFGENRRVAEQAKALENGDFNAFLAFVRQSGASSCQYLQNVVTETHQTLGLALAYSEHLLEGSGATRVHGGGFAGTMQAFVPHARLERYRRDMDALFGRGMCRVLTIRPQGVCKIV